MLYKLPFRFFAEETCTMMVDIADFWTAHHVVLLNCLRDWKKKERLQVSNGIIIVFYYFLYVRVSINSAVFFSKLCSRLSVQCLACLQSFSAFSRTSDSSLSDQQLVQLKQLFLKALIFKCNGSRFRGTWNQFLDPKIRCAYVLQFFFSVCITCHSITHYF